ncbi:FecCD family ABC transporter permease [Actinophytocola sp.]|uniref:FecCD family ABC transporter permease n=1 Tax=Actinophytocola sp. TaxID=1872138 RepID=UPI002D7F33FE|nr:iron chelate uptake ABC transporter family permease subunit [Actinophytocola sp.]HET9144359.1 iron chelate uptake ABC transporter family permease subunit [Actinophytocola sp.]
MPARIRPLLVPACLAGATAAAFCLGLAMGAHWVDPVDVVRALAGSGDRFALLTVNELRLPRALVGLLAGAAFGVAGAVFQTVTRNPLASPDMIGISAGAAVAVVAGIVLGIDPAGLGLAGGLLAALVVYLLAWNQGTTGYRIILVGVGVTWVCTSTTSWLLTKAELYQAQQAVGWLVGNLGDSTWQDVPALAVSAAVLVPGVLLLGGWLRTLQLGDEIATGLGTPVQRARLVLLLAGVGLVAFATAAAGPIAFIALASPQIARRLAGAAAPPVLASGLTGALVVLAADLLARQVQLPVGVVTGVFGAPFLMWLLIRKNRYA